MLSKTKLKEALEDFPEYFTIDELVGISIMIEKREHEKNYLKKKRPISVKELDREVEKWFKM